MPALHLVDSFMSSNGSYVSAQRRYATYRRCYTRNDRILGLCTSMHGMGAPQSSCMDQLLLGSDLMSMSSIKRLL